MSVDILTAKERMRCLLLNEPVDRVPFMPFFVGYLATNNGISLYDFYANPAVAFRAGEETKRKYPWANIRPVYGWADHGAWEFGGKIGWPRNNKTMTPFTIEPLVYEPQQVDELLQPNPPETEWYRLRSYFNEICVEKGYSAHLPSGSILAQLGSILGITNLMKWMKRYPDAIHRLARKVLRFNIRMAELTIEKYGAKKCSVMTDLTLESNSVISSEAFEQFCLPYIIRLHDLYYESGVSATMIHLCGDHKGNMRYWERVRLRERTIFSIGDVMDLEETSNFLGKKYILAGNISTTVIQFGTPEKVKEEVERCLKQAKNRPGGFILMPACEYPPLAPSENLEAIREALMECGFY
jgi:uroporphyrinogen decarboxylase